MPDGNQTVATTGNRDLATMRFEDALEVYSPNFAAVLPTDVPLEHFKRMVVTAVNTNPDLRYADRRTLFNACVKCASDGVLPDGREAALVIFRTKIKDQEGKERWIDTVNYMIMVAGIRKRLRNTGEVLSAEAEVVYANDHFRFRLGDNAMIEHEPAPLDQEPGNVVGAYAIIKLTNGEILREIVRLRDVDRARAASKAPNSPAWKDWYDQMARKVALRRCSKAAPSSSGAARAAQALERLLARDEESPELPAPEELPMIPPRPRREDCGDERSGDDATETKPFRVTDLVGEIEEFANAADAAGWLKGVIDEGERQRGTAGLQAVWESNGELIHELRARGHDDVADGLAGCYAERLAQAEKGSTPAAAATEDDFWARADLRVEAPLRPGTAAVNLPLLRDIMCNLAAGCPGDRLGRLEEFLQANDHNLKRLTIGLKDDARKQTGADDVRAAVAARRKGTH